MLAKILRRFKKGGNGSQPEQQLRESASGLEPEGSGASSDPNQALSLHRCNLRSEVDQTSTGDDGNRLEAPVQALASFFAGASGTIVSAPAQFVNSTGAQVEVHIHPPPANIMNTAEQVNRIVRTEESQTSGVILPFQMSASPRSPPPPPVNTMDVSSLSSSITETPHATESTDADVDRPPKDNEIYERLLRRKERGFALYVPEPNMQLPIAYQKIGVNIGDVGVITPDGGFSFLFNICAPHNDPINPCILPDDFSPLQPTLTVVDVVKFPRFKSGSYLASASIEKKESESNTRGLHFETSASEGAVLTMPEGAISLDLASDLAFSEYLAANVQKWYEFVHKIRRQSISNGQIRLIIGCDKTTAWGIATVSGMSQHKLKFKASDAAGSSTTTYTWECSGMVEVRVGPDKHDIEALRSDDTFNTTFQNQCLFVRTMTARLGNNDWAKLMRSLGKTVVEDPKTPSITTLDPSLRGAPSSSNTKSSSEPGSHQGTPGTQHSATGKGMTISTMPNSPPPYHPSDDVNQQLLRKFPNCRMVITKDQAWLSIFREGEEMVSDPEQLLERVLASHEIRLKNGVLHLDRKKEITHYPFTFNRVLRILTKQDARSTLQFKHMVLKKDSKDIGGAIIGSIEQILNAYGLRSENKDALLIQPSLRVTRHGRPQREEIRKSDLLYNLNKHVLRDVNVPGPTQCVPFWDL